MPKPKQVRVYLYPREVEIIERLAKESRQSESWLLTTLTAAALDAVEKNGDKFSVPLQMRVEDIPIPKRKTV